jgi:hypothetical protein
VRPYLNRKKLDVVTHVCHPTYGRKHKIEISSTMVQASLEKKQDPISKITRSKRVGGVAQIVGCQPSKSEALSSNPRTTKTIEGWVDCHWVS